MATNVNYIQNSSFILPNIYVSKSIIKIIISAKAIKLAKIIKLVKAIKFLKV